MRKGDKKGKKWLSVTTVTTRLCPGVVIYEGVGQPVRQPQSPRLQCYPLRGSIALIGIQAPIPLSGSADAAGIGWIGSFRFHRFSR